MPQPRWSKDQLNSGRLWKNGLIYFVKPHERAPDKKLEIWSRVPRKKGTNERVMIVKASADWKEYMYSAKKDQRTPGSPDEIFITRKKRGGPRVSKKRRAAMKAEKEAAARQLVLPQRELEPAPAGRPLIETLDIDVMADVQERRQRVPQRKKKTTPKAKKKKTAPAAAPKRRRSSTRSKKTGLGAFLKGF